MELAVFFHQGIRADQQQQPPRDDIHRLSPDTDDDLNSSLKIVHRRRRGGIPARLCRAAAHRLGFGGERRPEKNVRRRAASLRSDDDDMPDANPQLERVSSSADIREGFVVETAEGEPLFSVKERLGSGAFGVCFRAVRYQQQWERAHAFGDFTVTHEVGNPLSTQECEEGGRVLNNGGDEYAVKALKNPTPKLLQAVAEEARLMLYITEHENVAGLRFVYPLSGKSDCRDIILFNDLVEGGGRDLEQCMKEWGIHGDERDATRRDVSARMLDVSLQLARGLAHIHEKCNVIHFDIKPNNVCIATDGTVKIVDFGMSSRGRHQRMNIGESKFKQREWTVVWKPVSLFLWISISFIVVWAFWAGWQSGLARYPALRRRCGAPVLHAQFRGGTRGYFSPESAKAFVQIQSAEEGDEPPMLCAAETDHWAWAIITTRLFRPHMDVCKPQRGEFVGEMFRKHVLAEEPDVSEEEWIATIEKLDAAQIYRWLKEDLSHLKLLGSFVEVFKNNMATAEETKKDSGDEETAAGEAKVASPATENPDALIREKEGSENSTTGAKLATVLRETSTNREKAAWNAAFEGSFKFKVAYTICLRKIRHELGGGMAISLPQGGKLREILHRSFDKNRLKRPLLMSMVAEELDGIARCKVRVSVNDGAEEIDSSKLISSSAASSHDIVSTAQRVGALVNTANALQASYEDANSQKALDERVALLAEALETQRGAEIAGVWDDAGDLLSMLVRACFCRHRFAIVGLCGFMLIWWGYATIIRIWAHSQFVVDSSTDYARQQFN